MLHLVCKCYFSFVNYVLQVNIAHREQVGLTIDLEDLETFDPELSEAVLENTRRYVNLFANVVQDMLPDYKEKEVCDEFWNWKIKC